MKKVLSKVEAKDANVKEGVSSGMKQQAPSFAPEGPAGKEVHDNLTPSIYEGRKDEGRSWCFTTSELTLHPGWLLPFVFFFGDNRMSFLCTVHCTNDFTNPRELCFIVLCLNMQNCMQLHVTSYANCFLCYRAYLKLI